MTTLLPAFADPVRDSQAVFRAVLDAMSRPGQIHEVAAPAEAPAPLDRATAAVLLTLVDAESPLFLAPEAEAARDWLVFHCGAPLVDPASADFAVSVGTAPFARLFAGTDEEPERSTTLILQVTALGKGDRFTLRGPGIAKTATLAVTGLDRAFLAFWTANRRLFPRGIDIILCAGSRLAALPRTLAMEPS